MADYLELERLQSEKDGEVCIFGAGIIGRYYAYELLIAAGFRIDFFCDNHIEPGTHVQDGLYVQEIRYLYTNKDAILVFLCVSVKYQKEILEQLRSHGITNVIIIDNDYISQILDSIERADDAVKIKYFSLYDDREYLKVLFKRKMGYELDLDNPKTFNEKLQWLKLNERNPKYTKMVDKYEFKMYVEEVLGKGYTIPILGVYDSVDEIEWDKLPEQFVLKGTHDCGSVIICRDKRQFSILNAKRKLEKALSVNFYWRNREWPYKDVKPRIIAEEYMKDEDYEILNVYKVFNFHGIPRIIQVIQNDKTSEETIDYFDTEWKLLNLRQQFPNSENPLSCPRQLGEMLALARRLSEGVPFLRTDFYIINEKIYVSEFTFYSDAGMAAFFPEEWDEILGDLIMIK